MSKYKVRLPNEESLTLEYEGESYISPAQTYREASHIVRDVLLDHGYDDTTITRDTFMSLCAGVDDLWTYTLSGTEDPREPFVDMHAKLKVLREQCEQLQRGLESLEGVERTAIDVQISRGQGMAEREWMRERHIERIMAELQKLHDGLDASVDVWEPLPRQRGRPQTVIGLTSTNMYRALRESGIDDPWRCSTIIAKLLIAAGVEADMKKLTQSMYDRLRRESTQINTEPRPDIPK